MPGLSTKDGTPTGGVFGFASLAIEIIKKLEPDYVAVAWDKKGTSIRRRKELLPTYKAGRKTPPPDFFEQIPILRDMCEAFGWPLYEADDYEADDIMGTFAKLAEKQGIETCLVSSDLDMLQLVGPHTFMYAMKKGLANIELYDPEHFEEKYGIPVERFVDYKALVGDSSDNITGVPGVGPKAASALLSEYADLEDIYAHLDDIKPAVSKKLTLGKDSAYLSREVARIWCDAPVPLDLEDMDVHDLDIPRVIDLLKNLEFHSLIRRLPAHMQDVIPQGGLYVEHKIDALRIVPWTDELSVEERVVCVVHQGELWLSLNTDEVMRVPLKDVSPVTWSLLGMARVIGYKLKDMLHELASVGIQTAIDTVHDVEQAAFLLDPLQRDRSLAALLGGEVDEADPGSVAAALWSIYAAQVEAFEHKPKVRDIAEKFDFPLVRLLFLIEQRGVKVDVDRLARMSQELGAEYATLQQSIYDVVGHEFNIGSPAQLSEVLFEELSLPTTGIKRGKTSYSTDQKTLDKLRGLHPIVELIERTRELAKLKNTYVDALPELADAQGRIHTTFNQDVAATGRLSSTNPNLQNIPIRSELGRTIRTAFVAEPGNILVSADYSQFELRLAAALAGDDALIEDFNQNIDIHTKTAAEVYGISMDQVTKDQRRDAKVINFGVLYGMSPHGLAAATGMSFGDAKRFIEQYFALRAPIRAFIDATLTQAEEQGYVETFFGRRRPTPDIKSSNYMVRESAKRAAANMPIQGTEADLMKRAMLAVETRLDGKGRQILQIHDSILVETPREHADEVAEILRTTMESIAPELPISLHVDVSCGEDWGAL